MKQQNIYDNKEFFEEYQSLRKNDLSANELIEIPQLFELIGDVTNLSILDLGCGTGKHDRKLIEMGAKKIVGIDLSNNMINEAVKNTNSDKIEYKVMSMQNIDELDEKFDLVVSSLAIHYIEDYDSLCKKVYYVLVDGGRFIFSYGHPMDSCAILNDYSNNFVIINDKKYFLISDYNNEGKRISHWFVDNVETYHRNMSHLVNRLLEAGFNLEQMTESYATDEIIKFKSKYKEQEKLSQLLM